MKRAWIPGEPLTYANTIGQMSDIYRAVNLRRESGPWDRAHEGSSSPFPSTPVAGRKKDRRDREQQG